ncbi:rhomboid family intramembrane serine protease [Candidatus Bathyarchaeota archaeon]|nr:rhomboid family intramembrane serine protease [Candidatus Bathyarchaeota archaeon]
MRASTWIILLSFFTTLVTFRSPRLIEILGFTPMDLVHLRLWTLITALFLHSSMPHLLGNMLFLFVLGRTLERVAGQARFITVFFTGGVLSFILSIPFYRRDVVMVGSSAAIFSVASADMLITPMTFSIIFLAPVGAVALLYLLYNLASIYFGVSGSVAYISHVIGFILGLPFGIAWSRNWRRNLLISMLLLLVYIVVLWFLSVIVNFKIISY